MRLHPGGAAEALIPTDPRRHPWKLAPRNALQVAREALSELELPHLYRAVARGSPRRQELFKSRGLFQVPYLEVRPRACEPVGAASGVVRGQTPKLPPVQAAY